MGRDKKLLDDELIRLYYEGFTDELSDADYKKFVDKNAELAYEIGRSDAIGDASFRDYTSQTEFEILRRIKETRKLI